MLLKLNNLSQVIYQSNRWISSTAVNAGEALSSYCVKSYRRENMIRLKSVRECPKISVPGCPPLRQPLKCSKYRPPRECILVRAPLLSYHESAKPPIAPLQLKECRCFGHENVCTKRIKRADR